MSWRTYLTTAATAAALSLATGGAALAQSAPAALVIGNGDYANYADLRSSVADAEAIAAQLGTNGYDVTLLTDAGASDMRAALSAFLATGDTPAHRVLFYSGHSVSVDGVEFFVPADASVSTGLDLALNFIPVGAVTAQMNRDASTDFVILDTGYRHFADNELGAVLPGATTSDRPSIPADDDDTMTILAVTPGTNNLSQANRRNVFANILADRLARQDQDAVAFFGSLARQVANQSGNRQKPYVTEGFFADVVLNPSPVAPEPQGPTAREERLWNLVVGSDNVQDFEDYLAFFPDGYYADEARAAIAELTEPEAPGYTIDPINKPYYIVRLSNVRAGPSTDFDRLATLPENTIVNNLGKVSGTRWFQIVMPDNRVGYIFETLTAPWDGSELQAWFVAENEGTIAAYEAYLRDYPQGANAETAKNNILILREQAYQDALAGYSIQPINRDVVLLRRANVRQLPTTRSGVVATLEGGTRLTTTGNVRGLSWTQLDLNGTPVFIYDTLFVAYAGSVYEAWDQAVEVDSVLGYFRFRNAYPNSPFDAEAIAALQALQAEQNTGFVPLGEQYVVRRKANVFSQPNIESERVLQVKAGEVYQALRKTAEGRWIELRISRGEVGYIRASRVEAYEGSVFEAWSAAEAANSLNGYRTFRDAFPGSRFDDEAVAAIDALLADTDTIRPLSENIYLPGRVFVYTQPDTNSPPLGTLPGNSLVPASGIGGTPEFYRITTSNGQGYVLASAAELYIGSEREAWDNARRANTVEALNTYLMTYPNGRWLQDAIQLRQQLAPQQQGYEFNLGGLNIKLFPSN